MVYLLQAGGWWQLKDSKLDHFSAESEESTSDSKGQDSSRQSGSSSETASAKTSSGDSGQTQESTETSETSTSQTSLMSMSSREASLAKTSAEQAREEVSRTVSGQAYGRSMPERLARYDRSTRSWRTWQTSLGEDSTVSLETLPKRGIMRSGTIYELETLDTLIRGRGSSLLPTPTKTDATLKAQVLRDQGREALEKGWNRSLNLPTKILYEGGSSFSVPTPSKSEYKGSTRDRYRNSDQYRGSRTSSGLRTSEDDPIYLNPSFGEAIMGFPIGWTERKQSVTQSCQTVPNSSEKQSGGTSEDE